MNINDAFPGAYLKATDLQGRAAAVIIESCTIEKMGEDTRPVLHFQGKDKALVLNKTNANTVVERYGEETDAWTGKPLTVYPTTTDYQGKRVACLRVRVPLGPPPPVVAPPAAPGSWPNDEVLDPSEDSDIPF